MPQTLTIGIFVLGAVMLLLALVSGGFKIFGSEMPGVASPSARIIAFCIGVLLVGFSLFNSREQPTPRGPDDRPPSTAGPAAADTGGRAAIVGAWRADVIEFGVPTEIVWQIRPDGTEGYLISTRGAKTSENGTWTYENGVIYEDVASVPSSGSIKWIDNDHFDLTIKENSDEGSRGLIRHYSRL